MRRVVLVIALMSLVVLGVCGSGAWAGEGHVQPKLTFSKEFEKIKSLAGRWEGTGKDEKGQANPAAVEYTVTSGGTAVVEKLFPGTENEMVSVYHDKGGKLHMTHYCMLGNQPELELKNSSASRIDLDMSAASHASLANELHMHSLSLEWAEDGALIQTWVGFSPDGKVMEPTVIQVRKV